MILSVSRRTDIPHYYSDWFLNRIKEGSVFVRNPVNLRQVRRIEISPETLDCIVFWTKNPAPLIKRLDELGEYPYYFQFTLTGYGKDVEPGLPGKKEVLIPVFLELSERAGKERVVWRYDPILFSARYTPEYHLKAFSQIAESLRGYTQKCVISFVDLYAKNRRNLERLGAYRLPEKELSAFASALAESARRNGMELGSCAERLDLESCGIRHNSCIDRELIERLTGARLHAGRDKNQRKECGCIESIDVGAYHTCRTGCRYCYANGSEGYAAENFGKYDPDSPILCGRITENDRVSDGKAKSLREGQLSLWELQKKG